MPSPRAALAWAATALAIALPVAIAATSPLLEWRQPIYIAAGFAGIIGLGLLLLQPLFAAAALPGPGLARSRRLHRMGGTLLVVSVVVHVAGLWVFSPPDVIDALLLRSPTLFSPWGVLAMWAIFTAAALAVLRKRVPLRPMTWRRAHSAAVAIAVAGSVLHALLIDGTMGTVSKWALCALVVATTVRAVVPVWIRGKRTR